MKIFEMLDKLFIGAGVKIKVVAVIAFVLQLIAGIWGAISAFSKENVEIYVPLLIFIGAMVVAYVDSLLLYGFGEIVEAAYVYLFKMSDHYEQMQRAPINEKKNYYTSEGKMLCPHCWKELPSQGTTECPYCGKSL